jgi:acetyltransferase-like isoleucine patch superfamily enzyme
MGMMMVSDEEFIELVKRNSARIAAILMHTARVWGDPSRVIYKSQYPPHDTFFNVASGRVEVGKDCFFGHGCMLLTGTHDHSKFGPERVDSYPKEGRDIILEEGVWLASRVTVLGPATIGKHAVVGAGSLVRGDLPPYGIYVGNPACKVGENDPTAHSPR